MLSLGCAKDAREGYRGPMQGVERQLNLLHLNAGPGSSKMGTPHKSSAPSGAQEGEEVTGKFTKRVYSYNIMWLFHWGIES